MQFGYMCMPFCSWFIVSINIRTLCQRDPKAILDMIVNHGEVKDVMLLRKAAAGFTQLTMKGYVGNRFNMVSRLKSDMAKGAAGIPEECTKQVDEAMAMWDTAQGKFESCSATDDDWTVEAGVSMTNTMMNMAAELDAAHTVMAEAWEAVKRARKVRAAAATKLKNSAAKLSNEAVRPFIKNGVDGAWKAILFHFKMVTTGNDFPRYEASQEPVTSGVSVSETTVLDWSKPHFWFGQPELPANIRGHR